MVVSRFTIGIVAVAIAYESRSRGPLPGRQNPRFCRNGGLLFAKQPGRERRALRPTSLTAAHRTLPFGTRVRVTDPKSGRSVIVTVNDRGPFNKGRVIDVSLAAAKVLGMIGRGIIYVRAEVL